MPDITWEDPPPIRGTGVYHKHGPIAAALKKRRGEWGRVAEYANRNTANVIVRRICAGDDGAYAPAGDFDAVRREVDGVHYVYARYLGDGPDE